MEELLVTRRDTGKMVTYRMPSVRRAVVAGHDLSKRKSRRKQMYRRNLSRQVACRLEAVMQLLEVNSVGEFAALLEEDRTTVSHWLNSGYVPPLPAMIRLKKRSKITLDWIYLGEAEGMPTKLLIVLQALLDGMDVPRQQDETSPPPAPPKLEGTRKPVKRKAGRETASGSA